MSTKSAGSKSSGKGAGNKVSKRISVHAKDVICQPLQDIPNGVTVFISREGGVDPIEARSVFAECSHLLLRAEEAVAERNACAFLSLMRLLTEAFGVSPDLEAEGKAVFEGDSALTLSMERICHAVLGRSDALGLPGDPPIGMDAKHFALLGDYPQTVAVTELLQVLGVLCGAPSLKRQLGTALMQPLKSALLSNLWDKAREYDFVAAQGVSSPNTAPKSKNQKDAEDDDKSDDDSDEEGTSQKAKRGVVKRKGASPKGGKKQAPKKKVSRGNKNKVDSDSDNASDGETSTAQNVHNLTLPGGSGDINPYADPTDNGFPPLSLEGARSVATIFINLMRACEENKRLITWEFLPDVLVMSLDVYFQVQIVELMYRLLNKGPFTSSQLVKLWKRRSPVSTSVPSSAAAAYECVVDELGSLSPKKKDPLLQQMIKLVDAFHNVDTQCRRDIQQEPRTLSIATKKVLIATHTLTEPRCRVYFGREHVLILLGDAAADQVSLPYTYIRSVKVSADNKVSFRLYLAPTRARDLIKIDSAVGEDTISFEMTAARVADFRNSPVQKWIVDRLKARTNMAGSARRSSTVIKGGTDERETNDTHTTSKQQRTSTVASSSAVAESATTAAALSSTSPTSPHSNRTMLMTPMSTGTNPNGSSSLNTGDTTFIGTVERGTERGSLIQASRPHGNSYDNNILPRDSLEEALHSLTATNDGGYTTTTTSYRQPHKGLDDAALTAAAASLSSHNNYSDYAPQAVNEASSSDEDDGVGIRELVSRLSSASQPLVSPSKGPADSSPAPRKVMTSVTATTAASSRRISIDPDLLAFAPPGTNKQQFASPSTPSIQQLAVRLNFDATGDRPALPPSTTKARDPVDFFIDQKLLDKGTSASPSASPQRLVQGRPSTVIPTYEPSPVPATTTLSLSAALAEAFEQPPVTRSHGRSQDGPPRTSFESKRSIDIHRNIDEGVASRPTLNPTTTAAAASVSTPFSTARRAERVNTMTAASHRTSASPVIVTGSKRSREDDLEAALLALSAEVARMREQQNIHQERDRSRGQSHSASSKALSSTPPVASSVASSHSVTTAGIADSLRRVVESRRAEYEASMQKQFLSIVDEIQGSVDVTRRNVFEDVSTFEADVSAGIDAAGGAEAGVRLRVDELLDTYNTRLDLLKRWSRGEAREVAALAKISVDRALESARSGHLETMERAEVLSKHVLRGMEDRIHAAEYSRHPPACQISPSHGSSLRRSASSLAHPHRDSYTPAPPNTIHSALEPFRQFLADRMTKQ